MKQKRTNGPFYRFLSIDLSFIILEKTSAAAKKSRLAKSKKFHCLSEINKKAPSKQFPANEDLSGSYKFNSYRLTYRYDFVQNPNLEFGLGFTAKVRDAKIALSSQGISAEKSNVGFVPIINFRLFWHSYEKLGFLLEGDALAAKQGRAIDVLFAASYKLSDQLGIKAGYRILEGGADNDEVYNFALFHYLSAGVSYTF